MSSVKELRFLQQNAARSKLAMNDICGALLGGKFDVVLMQEPYTTAGWPANTNGVRVLCGDGAGSASACVLVRRDYEHAMLVSHLSNRRVCVVAVEGSWGVFYVVSLYCPPGEDFNVSLFKLTNVCEYLRGRMMIIGLDSNAKSAA